MKLNSIAVIGGGPGGLYTARLLKLDNPGATVIVHEQSVPETTFGFGVALAARTQRNLESADADTLRDIIHAGRPHDTTMHVGGRRATVRNGAVIGIARTELLAILARHAAEAGVELRFGSRVALDEVDADLVVVADGVSSDTREKLAAELEVEVGIGEGLYLWAGADVALDDAVFAPATTADGTFVAHAYPYAPDRTTFLIETDARTWHAAGFDATTARLAPDASDAVSLAYLERAFADHLQGGRLMGNRTRWLRFRTVRCARWSHGNVVLLGDAAHTAHYSIGSGTKLAMEDGIALRQAIAAAPDVPTALAQYELSRRPEVERLQGLARRSHLWWDSFPRRTGMDVDQLTVAYMTRAGNVSLDRFAATNPDILRRALATYAGCAPAQVPVHGVTEWVCAQPLDKAGRSWTGRVVDLQGFDVPHAAAPRTARANAQRLVRTSVALDNPWTDEGDALVRHLTAAARNGSPGVWLTGPHTRADLLNRLAFAERMRRESDAVIVVDGPAECLPDLAAGLASGRTDLICPLQTHSK
ncbi:FAD-dependent monooxygenase [Streptomyces sp. NPDC051976]|uniref:FAD-dependent monooxygenase n=1 Tax=Streptomyces sp. NPDC051976 TaxID=3154947 RepID=UPI0034124D31